MNSVGRFFRNLFGAGQGAQKVPKPAAAAPALPKPMASRQPKDTFASGMVFSNPIFDELAEMAKEMAPAKKLAQVSPKVEANMNYEQATKAIFEREYGEALNASLEAKGYRPLSGRQKSSVAKSYLTAEPRLGAKVCARIASEVMKKHITPADEAGASQAVRNAVKASPMPASYHNNIPVYVSSEIAFAQADTKSITLSPTVFDSPPSPMKFFLIGHEEYHVREKDCVGSLGLLHLKESLIDQPKAYQELSVAEQQLSYEKELAADRAGVDLALSHFVPEAAEKNITELLLDLAPMATYEDHPEMEARCDAISQHIVSRQNAKPADPNAVFNGLVFDSPIFDDLKEMLAV